MNFASVRFTYVFFCNFSVLLCNVLLFFIYFISGCVVISILYLFNFLIYLFIRVTHDTTQHQWRMMYGMVGHKREYHDTFTQHNTSTRHHTTRHTWDTQQPTTQASSHTNIHNHVNVQSTHDNFCYHVPHCITLVTRYTITVLCYTARYDATLHCTTLHNPVTHL